MSNWTVLVADSIALDGLAPLASDPRFTVVVKPGLSGDDLANAIADADAVLVRSATKITRASLARADRLKAIGRAGVGRERDAPPEQGPHGGRAVRQECVDVDGGLCHVPSHSAVGLFSAV